jgi:hypothetical protein
MDYSVQPEATKGAKAWFAAAFTVAELGEMLPKVENLVARSCEALGNVRCCGSRISER